MNLPEGLDSRPVHLPLSLPCVGSDLRLGRQLGLSLVSGSAKHGLLTAAGLFPRTPFQYYGRPHALLGFVDGDGMTQAHDSLLPMRETARRATI